VTAGVPAAGVRCASCGSPGRAGDRFCEVCGNRHDDPRDRVEVPGADLAGVSDRGYRHHHNEDALALRSLPAPPGRAAVRLAVVCDGVSSVPRPDLASAAAAGVALDRLAELLGSGAGDPEEALVAAGHAATDAVAQLTAGTSLPRPSACTIVAAVVTGDHATVGWLGDSRAYWLPADGGPIALLTRDDSASAHAITAWLGSGSPARDVHLATLRPTTPGALVLCTDGLWNLHDATSLAQALTTDPVDDPLGAARELVDSALARGGPDNVTAAVVPITVPSTPHDSTHPDGGTP
jgi:serine/threonine protein phosphatase PrpC